MKYYIFSLLIIMLYMSCTCEETEIPILERDIPRPFWVDSIKYEENQLLIQFNKPVKPGSVNLGESLLVDVENSTYTGVPVVDDKSIILSICDFSCAAPSCLVKITLKGDSQGIRSSNPANQLLDGDRDGTDGGDFIIEQYMEHCEPITPPYVVSPENGEILNFYTCPFDDNEFTVTIIFSEPMDTNSIIIDSTLSLTYDMSDGDIVLENMAWIDDTQLNLTFNSDVCFTCGVTINFFGEADSFGAVSAQSGLVLDGDESGEPGGTYETKTLHQTVSNVVSPEGNQTASNEYYTYTNQFQEVILKVDIQFSMPMDTTTSNSTSIKLTHLGTGSEVPLFFDWDINHSLLIITSQSDILSFPGCLSTCYFNLEINRGDTIQTPLADQSGVQLDGDEDCMPGGFYQTTFQFDW